ncbi:MAG: hypothetical protein CMO30_03750 [Tistrella sp.]|nr:hypothetical protein [Tistrella sp.]MBA74387.1 hypothetical protein [Tistrella sp.]
MAKRHPPRKRCSGRFPPRGPDGPGDLSGPGAGRRAGRGRLLVVGVLFLVPRPHHPQALLAVSDPAGLRDQHPVDPARCGPRHLQCRNRGGLFSGLFSLAAIWPSLAIGARRCHDRGRSGWFQLIMLIPLIGWIWLLVEIGFLRGTEGPNRFGPDPLHTGY